MQEIIEVTFPDVGSWKGKVARLDVRLQGCEGHFGEVGETRGAALVKALRVLANKLEKLEQGS